MSSVPVSGAADPGIIRVIVADSHSIYRLGLSRTLEQNPDIRVAAEAETYPEALTAAAQSHADVLLLEAELLGEMVQAVSAILAKAPGLRIVVVGDLAPAAQTLEMLRRGAQGVVERSIEPELMVKCVRCVAAGEPWLSHQVTHWLLGAYRNLAAHSGHSSTRLTAKEVFIANCVVQGMRNKDIAEEAGTTEQVVKNYLRKIFQKVKVADRMELAMYLLEHPIQDGIPLELERTDARPEVRKPTAAESSKPKVAAAAAGR